MHKVTARKNVVCYQSGFTLIEILIVVTLLAVLMTLAYPSYQQYQLRAHRANAIGQLMSIALCQERLLITLGSYDTGRCLPPATARHNFQYQSGSGAKNFVVEARPIGAQSDDVCGSLNLNHLGQRGISGRLSQQSRCWAAR